MAQTAYDVSSAFTESASPTGRTIHVCKPPNAGYAAHNGHSTGATVVNFDGCAAVIKSGPWSGLPSVPPFRFNDEMARCG